MAQPKEENPRTPHTSGFVVPTLAHRTRRHGAPELGDIDKLDFAQRVKGLG